MDINSPVPYGELCHVCNRKKTKTGRHRNFGWIKDKDGILKVICTGCGIAGQSLNWETLQPEGKTKTAKAG